MKLERWGGLEDRHPQQQAAARFLLMIAGRPVLHLGKFAAVRDLLALDDVHRRAGGACFGGQSL